ncbi:hypothetical protein B0H10DRAFT_1946356 [Mycena sp. CBHHK59/15]|nr:hypothetical protein B0H10DRAFT_1946356 [Mycena sp. CBHHK59/15]
MLSLLVPPGTPRPADPSLPELGSPGTVEIYHPAHRKTPMLVFQAFPILPDGVVFGVPLGVVLDGCFVVARNEKGRLLLLDSPNESITDDESDPDALLPPGEYLFVVGPKEGQWNETYCLCTSFATWTPPGAIPARWKESQPTPAAAPPAPSGASTASNVSMAVKTEDGVCIMTGAATGLQASLIVPRAEENWFDEHHRVVKTYGGRGSLDLNTTRNQVSLRVDLNSQGLDQGHFLLAPYAHCIVAVFVRPTGRDLAYMYHLKVVNMPTRILVGYLFIRFAWNIFKFSAPGLVKVAAAIAPRGVKRKTLHDTVEKVKKITKDADGSSGGGGGETRGNVGRDSEDSLPTEDKESGPKTEDKIELSAYEAQDAALQACPHLTFDDVQAGRYPGFSKFKRLQYEYRLAHPEVSAVRSARVWEAEEGDF